MAFVFKFNEDSIACTQVVGSEERRVGYGGLCAGSVIGVARLSDDKKKAMMIGMCL